MNRRLPATILRIAAMSMAVFLFFLIIQLASAARAERPFEWLDKVAEAKRGLKDIKLHHSPKILTYTETRKVFSPAGRTGRKSNRPGKIVIKRRDYAWKEAALALLNTHTGEIRYIKIKKEGQKLWNKDPVFMVEIEERVNGLKWNGKNTAFRVISGSDWVVIGCKWLELTNGKPRESTYVPYSIGLDNQELAEFGSLHLKADVIIAFEELEARRVESLALPGQLVSSVVPDTYPFNVILDEHTDPQEFHAFLSGQNKHSPFDRVKVLLALNGEEAFQAYNYAGAVGLTQFTNNRGRKLKRAGTWDVVRAAYKTAKLSEFKVGAADHIQSIMASALLWDYNLSKLAAALGLIKVFLNPECDYYLYAAHNCGIDRVIRAVKSGGSDWRRFLPGETRIYLEKLDFVHQ